MKKPPKYASPKAFRKALEGRLQATAKAEGIDLQRLRRQVAFDRLLARLFFNKPSPWSLKGGYAMELRTTLARATKDIDLNLRLSQKHYDDVEVIRSALAQALSSELHDHFRFLVGAAAMDLEAAPYGGARYPVESVIDEKTFVKFNLDIAIGDYQDGELEEVTGRDWLDFAGIRSVTFYAIPKEQQFAEKIHAYTLPRGEVTNSRVKDLIDLVLLIESKSLVVKDVRIALTKTFRQRKSHELPTELPSPPAVWSDRFRKLAEECEIDVDLDRAYQLVREFLKTISK